MSVKLIIALAVYCGLLAYAAYVIVRVLRCEGYTPLQKFVQSLIALLIPLLGALFVHIVLRVYVLPPPPEDTEC